ncbi:MAG: phage holin family protein [bacterium]|nr:phage holin family protein [bacterium]
MRKLLRLYLLSILTLQVILTIHPGFAFQGSAQQFLFAAAVFALLQSVVRPLLSIILLPLNLLTFNLFSILLHIIVLYFLTSLVPEFVFRAFSSFEVSLGGIRLAAFEAPQIVSVLLAAILLAIVNRTLRWLFA